MRTASISNSTCPSTVSLSLPQRSSLQAPRANRMKDSQHLTLYPRRLLYSSINSTQASLTAHWKQLFGMAEHSWSSLSFCIKKIHLLFTYSEFIFSKYHINVIKKSKKKSKKIKKKINVITSVNLWEGGGYCRGNSGENDTTQPCDSDFLNVGEVTY